MAGSGWRVASRARVNITDKPRQSTYSFPLSQPFLWCITYRTAGEGGDFFLIWVSFFSGGISWLPVAQLFMQRAYLRVWLMAGVQGAVRCCHWRETWRLQSERQAPGAWSGRWQGASPRFLSSPDDWLLIYLYSTVRQMSLMLWNFYTHFYRNFSVLMLNVCTSYYFKAFRLILLFFIRVLYS